MRNKSNKQNNLNQTHNERENGKLRVSESRSKVYFDYAEREQIQDDTVGLKLRVSESMVGTRPAVSEKQSTSGSRLKTASQRSMLSQGG